MTNTCKNCFKEKNNALSNDFCSGSCQHYASVYEGKINKARQNLLNKVYRLDPRLAVGSHIYVIDRIWDEMMQ